MKENSIEEDIILLKDFTEGNFKRDKLENYKGSYKMGYFYYKDIQQAIEHILKELKRFENMYEAEKRIHMVRNEQLARKQQLVIKCNELESENKELKKENEELKILKSGIQTLQDLRIEDGKYIVMSKNDFLNGSCKHLLDDYISKQEIKDIIDRIDYDIKKTKEIISKNRNIFASYRKNDYQIVRLKAMNTKSLDIKKRLQKLLESEE